MEIEHITDLVSALETVLNSPVGTRVTIDKTDWLYDADLNEVDRLYGRLKTLFQEYLETCMRELGSSTYTDVDARERVASWYPEALRLSTWQRSDGYNFLALAHHDRESPIVIELGSISHDELDELSE